MEKRMYISGPIAHLDLTERKRAFTLAESRINFYTDYIAVNPFKNGVPEEEHWSIHMKADIKLLLECDAIFMLKGWEMSKGCKLELDIATTIGLPVYFENSDGYKLSDWRF